MSRLITNTWCCAILVLVLFSACVEGAQAQVISQTEFAGSLGVGSSIASGGNWIVAGSYGAAYVFMLSQGQWMQQAKLTPTDGETSFGTPVAVSGTSIVVGAPGGNSNSGAAYVFTQNNGHWTQQAKLVANDGLSGDSFGSRVAIAGNTVVIGTPSHNNGVGAAYVFTLSNGHWTQQAELSANDGVPGDYFGGAVAMCGGNVVVGSESHQGTGAVYVFAPKNGHWTQQAELSASDGQQKDYFGSSLAGSGNTLVIGAQGHTNNLGAAYIFTLTNGKWSQQAELTASDGQPGDYFGSPVAIAGNTVVVGVSNYSNNLGAAYVFTLTNGQWTQQEEITASDGLQNGDFGESVAVVSNGIVVGANNHVAGGAILYSYAFGGTEVSAQNGQYSDSFGYAVALAGNNYVVGLPGRHNGRGSVCLYTQNNGKFTPTGTLTAADSQPGDSYGAAIALSGSTLAVAAPYAHGGAGAVYLYAQNNMQWTLQAELRANDSKSEDLFGSVLALNGTTLAIGSPGKNNAKGALYLFALNNGHWTQQTELVPSDGQQGDQFGASCALTGGNLVVGAPNASPAGKFYAGAVYVYTQSKSAWTQQAKLTAADGQPDDQFGSAVCLSGNTIAIGAPSTNNSMGTTYLYTSVAGKWTQQGELTTLDGVPGDAFGGELALSGNTLLVGAYGKNMDTGGVYLFTLVNNTWSASTFLFAQDGQPLEYFGATLALSGNTAVIGAPYSNDGTGSLYTVAF